MAHPGLVCAVSRVPFHLQLSCRAAGRSNVRHSGLRHVRLPVGVLSTRMLLAGRAAPVEPAEQLRPPFPCPMEYAEPIPVLAHLPGATFAVVAVVLLSRAHVLGWAGNVSSDVELDPSWSSRRPGWRHLCL